MLFNSYIFILFFTIAVPIFFTAKKINTNTSIGKFDLVNKVNILNHILEKYLNLHIGPANHRKTYFPKKNFFKEKIYMIKNYFLK